jgi:site-specific DNA recombinase
VAKRERRLAPAWKAQAIGYVRVSTEEQGVSGLGLEAQAKAIREAADRCKMVLGPIFRDVASGSLPPSRRPGLRQAIDAVGDGFTLLVAKRDRLARDTFYAAMIERQVEDRGGRIMSVAGEGTADDMPSSRLMRRMVDAFAEYEREMIGFRTMEAIAAKVDRGERQVGRWIEYGWKEVRREMRTRKDGTVAEVPICEPCPEEQAIIGQMRAHAAAGKGTRWISSWLNQHGVATRNPGAKWTPWTVQKIIARDPVQLPGLEPEVPPEVMEEPDVSALGLPIDPKPAVRRDPRSELPLE